MTTPEIKQEVKRIESKYKNFDEIVFKNNWRECYSFERNYGTHGKPSNAADIMKVKKYNELANIAASWARTVIHYYIDTYSQSQES